MRARRLLIASILSGQILLLSGCQGTTARIEKVPLPECPKDYAELERGWIGDGAQQFRRPIAWEIHKADGTVERLRVWLMTVEDRRAFEVWIARLVICARARGAVIEELNK